MKGCAPTLALTTRHNVTRKWPITIRIYTVCTIYFAVNGSLDSRKFRKGRVIAKWQMSDQICKMSDQKGGLKGHMSF